MALANDYERLSGDLKYAIGDVEALDGVDPDIEELIAQAQERLENAKALADERS